MRVKYLAEKDITINIYEQSQRIGDYYNFETYTNKILSVEPRGKVEIIEAELHLALNGPRKLELQNGEYCMATYEADITAIIAIDYELFSKALNEERFSFHKGQYSIEEITVTDMHFSSINFYRSNYTEILGHSGYDARYVRNMISHEHLGHLSQYNWIVAVH